MKIAIVGAGPSGLYFGILMKRADPSHEIVVFERNRYSVPGAFANRVVSLRAYAQRIVVVAEGQVVAEHQRVFNRDHTVKGGTVHGATDEFGFEAVEKPVEVHDLHATILHLLGFDHERFTYRYAGRDFRLTDVSGKVIKEIVA